MKAAMSGQKIGLVNRLSSAWHILRAYQRGVFGNAASAVRSHRVLCDLITTHARSEVKGARILDIGCGQTATQVALFAADGADVTGIDMEVPTYRMGLRTFVRALRMNGLERAVKSLLRHLLFDWRFFSQLRSEYGKALPLETMDVRIMDASRLSFRDSSFDFVYSSAVFEHVADVRGAAREVNRVLKPSGVARIGVHLFPSLSGGHHLEWSCPDENPSRRVPPWDHLFDNRFPANTYLNKLRLRDYRQILSEEMSVMSEERVYEGERILTKDLERRLHQKGYAREDLITRGATFLCRKRMPRV